MSLIAAPVLSMLVGLAASRADEPRATAPAAVSGPGTVAIAAAPVLEAPTPDPGCDDDGPQRRGVQKRDFLKRHRVELSAVGGFFASDLLSTSYDYGGSLAFYLTEDLGLEATLLVTPFDLGVERPLVNLFAGERFHAGTAYVVVGNLVWSLMHLKVRASEHAIIHGDIAFFLGAGDTIHDSVQGVTFDVGVGLKLYPTRWLALRFDLRDYLMVQEVVSVQRAVNDLVGTAGLSVFIPPWF